VEAAPVVPVAAARALVAALTRDCGAAAVGVPAAVVEAELGPVVAAAEGRVSAQGLARAAPAAAVSGAASVVVAELGQVAAVEALEAAEAESPVAGDRRVEAAEKALRPGSGSQLLRYCAGDPLREAEWPAQAAEKAAFPCRKKMCAPCLVCSRNWASRARIPKRAWKCRHFNRD